ncbi:MAG: disulfide bond formation protein DsbD [Bacteroidetes bacterium]|nr:MAG: disulfide bond formation protein DsbD [Bacteroidota bacterium]
MPSGAIFALLSTCLTTTFPANIPARMRSPKFPGQLSLRMKKIIACSFFLFAAYFGFAQTLNPVQWRFETKKVADHEFDLIFIADADAGWHIYSQHVNPDGPIPTTFNFKENKDVELVGETKEAGERHEGYDEMFDMNLVKFSGRVLFTQRVKVQKLPAHISGYLEFMTCDNQRCLPPREVDFQFDLE